MDIQESKNTPWAVGDVVRLKKPHPCGGTQWEILKIGMDFRIQCMQCKHYLLLPRQDFIKKVKSIVIKVDANHNQ